jgi:hypothetical protein
MTELLRAGAAADTSLRPAASPAQSQAGERGEAPGAQESIPLEPGKPIERELSGGQSHSYRITMTAGQYLQVSVDQRGIDVLVTLFAPDGEKGIESDNPNGTAEPEIVTMDFEASRKTALRPELGQYRIVHFATHGMLNNIHPELSGIVLSLVDDYGKPQDGFLRLQDIYNLKLPAELVVLSACETGLGKEIKGEGLIGLTRGFMYAGAPRIVASLWKVDDRATSELMKRFYLGMLGPEALRPAGALRQAQLSIWKEKQWREPYYWAAFVLQGEWK